ncbi:EGF-like domain-containing protein [Cavenderia fasciculata]|uniref:EGF-like domain-containing protein n=1 Tax=Cavenderia fasciculata TaxID=261658 RepID=F4Q2X9_CACFS|nr:EGF-like domain-containing protein [Cavenderia fasciculata]EGG17543.1 EGF-like domain-containing protein [Cavenderia fasciculata]|eukprot:XP_004356027.1 EGF-like domain-containing protein [Cavenderia fasciculata]
MVSSIIEWPIADHATMSSNDFTQQKGSIPTQISKGSGSYSNGSNKCSVVEFRFQFIETLGAATRTITTNDTLVLIDSITETLFSSNTSVVPVKFTFPIGQWAIELTISNTVAPLSYDTITVTYNCFAIPSPIFGPMESNRLLFDPFTVNTGVIPIYMEHYAPPPTYTCTINNTAYTQCTVTPISLLDTGYSHFYVRVQYVMSKTNYHVPSLITVTSLNGNSSSFVVIPWILNGATTVTLKGYFLDPFEWTLGEGYPGDSDCRVTATFGLNSPNGNQSFVQHLYDTTTLPVGWLPDFRPILGTPISATYISTIDTTKGRYYSISKFDSKYAEAFQETSNNPSLATLSAFPTNVYNLMVGGNGVRMMFFNSSITSFSPVRNSTISYANEPFSISLPYPYGLTNGLMGNNIKFTTVKLLSPFQGGAPQMNITSFPYFSSKTSTIVAPALVDSIPPVVTNVEYLPLDSYSIIVRVEATDALSGVYRILIGQGRGAIQLKQYDLVFGDKNHGVFEVVFKFTHANLVGNVLSIYDEAGNMATYTKTSNLGFNAYRLPDIPYNYFGSYYPQNITYFKFRENNIATTNMIVFSELRFNVSNLDKNFKPKMQLFTTHFDKEWTDDYMFEGHYDPILDLYVIPFKLPMNLFARSVEYSIFVRPFAWTPRSLVGFVGKEAYLNVTSAGADEAGPIFTGMSVLGYDGFFGNQYVVSGNTAPSFWWKFTIKDQGTNAFSWGEVVVSSNLDPLPYIIKINSDNFDGTSYTATIKLPPKCRSQNFKIANMTLYDSMGHRTILNAMGFQNVRAGFSASAWENYYYLDVGCGAAFDNVAPVMTGFDFYPKAIDVSSENRTIYFSLNVSDSTSGLDTRHIPKIYLTSLYDELLVVETVPTFATGMLSANYNAKVDLPYGFGIGGTLVSIYGISDYHLNNIGFSAADLNLRSLPFFINTTFTPSTLPVIYSVSNITSDGGLITLFGDWFGRNNLSLVGQFDYLDKLGYINTTTVFFSGTLLVFNLSAITRGGATVRVIVNGINSNELSFNTTDPYIPTPEPTLPPITCTNNCSNHGTCDPVLGCQCEVGWGSSDCSFPVNTNTSGPINNQTDPSSLFGKGNLTISRIMEVDSDDHIVWTFTLANWTFTNKTDEYQELASLTYYYSATLENRSTEVTVIVQYFTNPTNYTFAGDTMVMSPNSLKYSVYLSSYRFASVMNRLVVVMSASLDDEEYSCSGSKNYGFDPTGKSVMWLQLKVDDQILYSRFIRKGMIDGRPTTVTNTILDEQNNSNSSITEIGINIPHYSIYSMIDPDFSLLIDPAGKGESSCGGGSGNGLRTATIAIIAVAATVLVVGMVAASIYITRKKRRLRIELEMDSRRRSGLSVNH